MKHKWSPTSTKEIFTGARVFCADRISYETLSSPCGKLLHAECAHCFELTVFFCLCRPPISVFFAPAAAYEHARLFSHKTSTDSSVRILRNENDENIGHDTSNSARMQIPEMTTGQDKSRRGNGSIMLSPEIALMAYLTLSGLAFLKLSLMSEGSFLHICVRSPFTSPKCD